MKRYSILVLFFGALTLFSSAQAQKPQRVLDVQNMREGENVEYCITHKKHTALLQNPDYVKGLAIAEAEYETVSKKGESQKATIYTIPVVFHVLHFGGIENISDEQDPESDILIEDLGSELSEESYDYDSDSK